VSSLFRPVRDVLFDPHDEASAERVWHRIQAHRRVGDRRLSLRWAAFPVAAVFGAALGWVVLPRPVERPPSTQGWSTSPGCEVAVLQNSPEVLWARQTEGVADYALGAGAHRRWVVEAGPARVETAAARFRMRRTGHQVEIEVSQGNLRVLAAQLENGAAELLAGDHLEVRSSVASEVPPPAASVAPVTPRPNAATKVLSAAAPARATDPVAELFDAADRARRAGSTAEAARLLSRIGAEFPADPRAALAMISLGRLQLDVSNDPRGAARSFEAALQLGAPQPLLEDVRRDLVEAQARAGSMAQ
jgi:hypothetical protein